MTDAAPATPRVATPASLRVDRWLWFARVFKSRTLAARFAESHHLRVNGAVVTKANHGVHAGDVLTFAIGDSVRVLRVRALGERRGPAPEARTLYEDIAPAADAAAQPLHGRRDRGAGRPTKAERRAVDRLLGEDLGEAD